MISVLIPAYNYDVSALVEEVYTQLEEALPEFEVIVCNDASTTGMLTDDFLAIFQKVKYLKNETNLGRTLTRKKLAETARYNNLLFLDADVLPVKNRFIKAYLPYLNTQDTVVIGGIAYKREAVTGSGFRLAYGIAREEKNAAERGKNPYGTILSGNFLIDKKIFFANNFPEEKNLYGMDLYFAYSLWKNNIKIVHIDNAVYHLGLEPDEVFFRKSIEAVKNRKALLEDYPEMAVTNGLLKQYIRLKKWKLKGFAAFGFRIFAPLMKKMILAKNPNLTIFDLYRLGYLCSLD